MTTMSMTDEDGACFYCGGRVTRTDQRDHFPIPEHLGGTETVPCCVSCRAMKDRPLDEWPREWMSVVLSDVPKMSDETRIVLAHVLARSREAKH